MTHHSDEQAIYWDGSGAVRCRVLHRGAHTSLVSFHVGGISYEVYVDNDDLNFEDNEEEL